MSDWTLGVGPKDYKIHKVIVATGPRASAFLAASFREHCGETRERTDLTGLVPKSCWQYMDALLDFIYDGEVSITVENWGSFVKMADLLQIGALYTKCVEVGSELITQDSAPKIAADAVQLQLGGDLQQEVVDMCVDAMAPLFSSYSPEDLAGLPLLVFEKLLLRDDLEVANEDDVFNFLLNVSAQLDSSCMAQLWKYCRLHHLSPERVLEVGLIPEISKQAVVWALAQQRPSTARKAPAPPTWVGDLGSVPAGPRGREISFQVQCPTGFASKKSLRSPAHKLCDRFRWRLLVFPLGTESTGNPRQLAAFIEIVPDADVPATWKLKHVKYSITVVNWRDDRLSVTKEHMVDFSVAEVDSGWHRGWVPPDNMTACQGWLNDAGELCFRARCCVKGSTATGLEPAEKER